MQTKKRQAHALNQNGECQPIAPIGSTLYDLHRTTATDLRVLHPARSNKTVVYHTFQSHPSLAISVAPLKNWTRGSASDIYLYGCAHSQGSPWKKYVCERVARDGCIYLAVIYETTGSSLAHNELNRLRRPSLWPALLACMMASGRGSVSFRCWGRNLNLVLAEN
jgi:hypothetical protein